MYTSVCTEYNIIFNVAISREFFTPWKVPNSYPDIGIKIIYFQNYVIIVYLLVMNAFYFFSSIVNNSDIMRICVRV